MFCYSCRKIPTFDRILAGSLGLPSRHAYKSRSLDRSPGSPRQLAAAPRASTARHAREWRTQTRRLRTLPPPWTNPLTRHDTHVVPVHQPRSQGGRGVSHPLPGPGPSGSASLGPAVGVGRSPSTYPRIHVSTYPRIHVSTYPVQCMRPKCKR